MVDDAQVLDSSRTDRQDFVDVNILCRREQSFADLTAKICRKARWNPSGFFVWR